MFVAEGNDPPQNSTWARTSIIGVSETNRCLNDREQDSEEIGEEIGEVLDILHKALGCID